MCELALFNKLFWASVYGVLVRKDKFDQIHCHQILTSFFSRSSSAYFILIWLFYFFFVSFFFIFLTTEKSFQDLMTVFGTKFSVLIPNFWMLRSYEIFPSHFILTDTGEDSKLVHRRIRSKVCRLFSSSFFRRVRATSMTQHRVEITLHTLDHFRLYRFRNIKDLTWVFKWAGLVKTSRFFQQ